MATESLTFRIGANTDASRSQMAQATKSLAGIAAAFVSVRAVTDSFAKALDMGGRLSELASETSETAGNLAILERAFQNAGAGAENAGTAIAKMNAFMGDAKSGAQKANDVLGSLGLTLSDLQGKSPTEQMGILAERIAAIKDPTDRANVTMDVFGIKQSKLIPLLRAFSSEIAGAKEQLGSLPEILNKSAAEFDKTGDSLDTLHGKVTDLSVGFLSELLPAVNKTLDAMTGLDAAGTGKKIGHALTDQGITEMQASLAGFLKNNIGGMMGPIAPFKKQFEDYFGGLQELHQGRVDEFNKAIKLENSKTPASRRPKKYGPDTVQKPEPAPEPADDLNQAIRKSVEDFQHNEIMDAMKAAFGPVQEAAAGIVTHFDEAKESAEDIATSFDAVVGRNAGGSTQTTVGRQERATKIKGANFKSSAFGEKLGFDTSDSLQKRISGYGYNPDGTPRNEKEFSTGKQESAAEKAMGKMKQDANTANKRNGAGAGASVLETLVADMKRILEKIEPKLPQQVMT